MPLPNATRLELVERDIVRHERRLTTVETKVDALDDQVIALSTRVGIYAALGGSVGGGALATVVGIVVFLLTR